MQLSLMAETRAYASFAKSLISNQDIHLATLMNLDDIHVYILTYNEQENIAKTLDALAWAREILIVDSFSDDATLDIAENYANVRIVKRIFDNHSNQHNYALEQISTSGFVLRLDADWIVSGELLEELKGIELPEGFGGVRIPFSFSIYGESVPISLYPPVVALFKRDGASYAQDGHTERLLPVGDILECRSHMIHEDKKSLDRLLLSQIKYSRLESEKISGVHQESGNWKMRIRSLPGVAPLVVGLYLLILKGGLFRGRASLHYVLQRLVYECMISLRILDERIRNHE